MSLTRPRWSTCEENYHKAWRKLLADFHHALWVRLKKMFGAACALALTATFLKHFLAYVHYLNAQPKAEWEQVNAHGAILWMLFGLVVEGVLCATLLNTVVERRRRQMGCTCYWDGSNPPFRYCRNHKECFHTGEWPVQGVGE